MLRLIRKNIVNVILFGIMFAGFVLIGYPTFANWWNSFHQTQNVSSYVSQVAAMNHEEYDAMLREAEDYNAEVAKIGNVWNLSDERIAVYNSLLNINDTGVMGYIDIPSIHITLPIYHGTDEDVLQVAIGHLAGTSLPVGGESSHCIVSGHRGLPSARLFTDIDKLSVGDTWTLNILDQTLTYEVDQVRVVKPSNLKNLQIEPGKDYCTLVTCTPYGVNTHRLLVRGHRIEIKDESVLRVVSDAAQIQPMLMAVFVAIPLLILLFLGFIVDDSIKQKYLR